jgi:hypothetical protein
MKPTRRNGTGAFATLFDFSFTESLTLKVVRLLYLVAAGGGAVAALAFGAAGFGRSSLTGAGTLLVAVIVYLVGLAVTRLWLEAVVVFFRLADTAAEIAEQSAQIAVNTGWTGAQRAAPPVGAS